MPIDAAAVMIMAFGGHFKCVHGFFRPLADFVDFGRGLFQLSIEFGGDGFSHDIAPCPDRAVASGAESGVIVMLRCSNCIMG
jgi:hypothetical protein